MTPRPLTTNDAAAVAALIRTYDAAHDAVPDVDVGDLLDEWRALDLPHDSFLWEEDGRVVAFATVHGRGEVLQIDGYVHPDERGKGLGTEILRLGEERIRERGGTRVHVGTLHADSAAAYLLEKQGYRFVRAFLRMGIELDAEPAEPELPDGLELVALEDEDDAEVHAVVQEAFLDSWDHQPRDLEQFRRRYELTDRSLWFGVRDGGRLVAVSVNENRFGAGWIGSLGTLREWRGRGLAQALLLASFRLFRERGVRTVQLGVDAESPTGAVRVYERVGMHVVWRADVYEKHL